MEPNATNETAPIGLSGLHARLPVDKIEGKNTWQVVGWEPKAVENEEKYVLLMADRRKTGAMGANDLLSALDEFELAHPDIMFRSASGGQAYKKTLTVEFHYSPKHGAFKSPYSQIRIAIAQPSPTKTVGGGPMMEAPKV